MTLAVLLPDAFWTLDAVPLLAAVLSSVTLALLGATLVLRRRAMVGDALSHAVLPGIVVAYMLTGSRGLTPMFAGALAAAVTAALGIGAITRLGRVDPSTAIGIVFTTLFALGVFLVETTGARNVHLDLDCVLSGQLELLFWMPPEEGAALLSVQGLASLPRELYGLMGVALLTVVALAALWSPIKAASFDGSFAAIRGGRPGAMHAVTLGLTALALVASFEALGSILVIALLTCPPAAARMLTRRYTPFVMCSVAVGLVASVGGYALAAFAAPAVIGQSIDASGTIGATAGLIVAVVAVLSRWTRLVPG